MKIIIDIPEETYNFIKENSSGSTAHEAIKNGTPLPKGHGDLIDRTTLMNRPYETGGFVEWYDEIKYAPTIIEAEKETDHGKEIQ